MKSLIHTNPKTKETRWCVANVIADIPVDVYIRVVNLCFRDDESHKPENFKWVEEPEGISMSTHEYKNGRFLIRPPIDVVVPTLSALSAV